MMVRRGMLVLLASLILPLAPTAAHADFVAGSIGFGGFGLALSPNDLGSAGSFTLGSALASSADGGFASVPTGIGGGAVFQGGTFSLDGSTKLTLSSSSYGTFTQTEAPVLLSVVEVDGVVVSRTFQLLGTYSGGAVGGSPLSAGLIISFTQNAGPGTALSASATLSVPAATPEPASVAMLGFAGVALTGVALRRRPARA